MSINFPENPATCATFGYSYDFYCNGDGVTHTVDQNWRVMLSPDGTTFFAPVTTVASVDASVGPKGDQGIQGETGMTGMTGVTGARGPAGITVEGAAVNRLMYISDVTDPEQTQLTVFTATTVQKDDASGQDILRIQSVRENIANAVNVSANSVTFDHATAGNNVRLNLNATPVNNIHLRNLKSGDYMNIICEQSVTNPSTDIFKSVFTASNDTDQFATTLKDHFAGGITYGLGGASGDIDVFYVQCLSASTGNSPTIELLINHQRYHS